MNYLKMTEIYGGKDPQWRGWHNLTLTDGNPENDLAIAGPLDPETSKRMREATSINFKKEGL